MAGKSRGASRGENREPDSGANASAGGSRASSQRPSRGRTTGDDASRPARSPGGARRRTRKPVREWQGGRRHQPRGQPPAEHLVAPSGEVGDLTNPAALRALLRRHGMLRTNKSLGQHLLISREALMEVVAAAELTPADAVLEVGAGPGVLTVELAERVRRVVAVELDRAMLPVLAETTARFANVEILPKNLLDVEPAELFGEQPYKLVANLPYYITALTLRHFLEARQRPELLVVMVQREVAERIAAKAGEMSLLGLAVQFYGAPRIVATIPPDAFYPPPKVESAVVRVDLHPQPPLSPVARDRLFQLAHAGFAEKRKQLHNSLARNLDVAPETVACWLARAGIDPARRAQTLSVEEWVGLTEVSLSSECGPSDAASASGSARNADSHVDL